MAITSRTVIPILSIVAVLALPSTGHAAATFASANIGGAGVATGVLISTNWYGVRVAFTEDTRVETLGAHIVADPIIPGQTFLALFPVDGPSDLPDCGTTDCAAGVELFTPPAVSTDVILPVDIEVTAGDYILVVGTYSAGATGRARVPNQNPVIGTNGWVRRTGSNGSYTWSDYGTNQPVRLFMTYADCGDGVSDLGEACDDGNALDTDACLSSCEDAACGDGAVYDGVEACDDGNDDDSDACTSTCEDASCGDGLVQADVEECDDGNRDGSDECTNACTQAACGDGIVQTGVEDCDDGNDDDTDACVACASAHCGDGVVQAGVEECDDGNRVDDDGCDADCTESVAGSTGGGSDSGEPPPETTSGGSATSGGSTTSGDSTTTDGVDTSNASGSSDGPGTSNGAHDTDTDTDGASADGGGGCRVGTGGHGLLLFALAGLGWRRRRTR